jgi:hypothetical protein
MAANIFPLEVEGKAALGFDPGLDAQAFAQAKMARFITQPGFAVFPGGQVEEWKASGVIEYPLSGGGSTLVIWGPPFAGERLDMLIEDDSRKDAALAAVRRWVEARIVLKDRELSFRPTGALVSPSGVILFPPEDLAARCLRAGGDEVWLRGESYVHPDLKGQDGAAFTAAAMFYRIFAGTPPFPGGDEETQHQNIRERVFLPVNLAAPGLDEKTAALINAALAGGGKSGGPEGRPDPSLFLTCPGSPGEAASGEGAAVFFHPLPETERNALHKETARFWKKKNAAVHTRRFVIRNATLLAGLMAAAIIAVLAGRSIAESRAAFPSTGGMDSAQVIRTYYHAIGALDHRMMEAAVIHKAGKTDIDMVANFFVINKVRQAYEHISPPLIPAQEWRDAGSPSAGGLVFGVSDLEIEKIAGDEGGEEMRYRASFILWLPAGAAEGENEYAAAAEESPQPFPDHVPPIPYPCTDELTLIRRKGGWRIAVITRTRSYGENNGPKSCTYDWK